MPQYVPTPGYRGFVAFCEEVGYDLAPFQQTIARPVFGSDQEVAAVLPRGQAKSTLAALLAVHEVCTNPAPSVFVGAGSRDQARVIGRIIERYARHPAVAELGIVPRHDELRTGLRETVLKVVAADGGQAHGWERPTLMLADEVWGWSDREPTLLGAMQTALIKNPQATLFVISTPAATLDGPLGRMRTRALAQSSVTRRGAHTHARGGGLTWHEWSTPQEADVDDARVVKRANPAPWITVASLAAQRARVTDLEYRQFHAGQWGVGEAAWLPPGAWQACAGEWAPPEEPVWLGIDIGGSRAASAVVGVTKDLHVAEIHVYNGDEAVLDVAERVVEIAGRRPIIEVAYDPWRFRSEALRLERERGLVMVEFGQSHARMTAASENLHAAIVSRRLTHPDHPELNRHIAAAIAKQTGRGWRLEKSERSAQIDAAVALAMALQRAEAQAAPEPLRILGWL